MSAVVDLVSDVVGGIVEAVGDVVETIGDVVEDVAKAVDQYVIQPILDDPLTAIATIGAAAFLGPGAAAMFGTSASVGVGIAAGAANAAAGLVQGESFDEAIKGGLMAGVSSGLGAEFSGGTGLEGSATPDLSMGPQLEGSLNYQLPSSFDQYAMPGGVNLTPTTSDSLDQFLAQNDNFGTSAGQTSPVPNAGIQTTELGPQTGTVPEATPAAAPAPAPSPLQSLNTPVSQVEMPSLTSVTDSSLGTDYGLSSGMKPDFGLQANNFKPADSFNMYGDADYSVIPKGVSGGPGMQMPSAPNLARMGGGQGLTADMTGLPQYMENGVPTQFQGANGKIYGAATPDMTVSSSGALATPSITTYDPTTNMGTPSVWDKLTSGNISGAATTAGGSAIDWVKNASPWQLAGAGLGAATLLGGVGGGPPSATPPTPGGTRDANFNKPLDLYEYMRDRVNYTGDLTKYGQQGQGGEHQFYQNTRFVPVPIPGQAAVPAKMGGLIQMKHFAQGGPAQGGQDPRQAQMMQAMAQQQAAGRGMPPRGMPPQGGRPPMMPPQGGRPPMPPPQGGRPPMPPPQGMPPQGMPPQGMPPQPPRDPRTAYYQYGKPPGQANTASQPRMPLARGGLSSVSSMRIGGGADGRTDDVPAVLSDGEYVMDAETVAMLGNGSSRAGSAKLDQMRANLRKQKGQALAKGKISPDARSPLSYLKGV